MEYTFCQFFCIGVLFRDSPPQEHAFLVLVECAAKGVHDFLCNQSASTVGVDVCFAMPFDAVLICLCRGKLYASERAAVNVALYFQNPLDELGV